MNAKKMGENRFYYEFEKKNNKGESMLIEITKSYYDTKSKNSLPVLWKKHGYTNKVYDNCLHAHCYCTDSDGNCWERYNPTIKLSDDGCRNVINFDWLLEVSDENINKLINEISNRFYGKEIK